MLSVLAVPMIGNLFRFASSTLKSILESASILFVALINPLFLLYSIASPFRPADRTVRSSRILIPLAIPFCRVIFHYETYRPREGHFVWILGIYLILVSGYSANQPAAFFQKRAGNAKGDGLLRFLRNAPDTPPEPEEQVT